MEDEIYFFCSQIVVCFSDISPEALQNEILAQTLCSGVLLKVWFEEIVLRSNQHAC